MRVLVTGMTSRQTKEDRTIAGALAEALRARGHEVTVDRPSLKATLAGETREKYDHAFVGLGPLHGIGTSYKYGALSTIGTFWSDDLTLYLDDVDSGKIGSGLRIMHNHNWKLTKPFYGYCAEYEQASQPEVQSWLLSVVDAMLAAMADHPRMLVPAFTFDDAFKTASKISGGAASKVTPIDWSTMATTLKRDTDAATERYGKPNEETPAGKWWAVEHVPENRQVRSLGPFTWPVHQVMPKALEVMYDAGGYLAPGTGWTPRFYQVAEAGLPIVSPWRVFADYIGDAFEVLAGTIELMDKDEQADLNSRQLEQLKNFVPSPDEIAKIVEGVMNRTYEAKPRVKD